MVFCIYLCKALNKPQDMASKALKVLFKAPIEFFGIFKTDSNWKS